MSAPDLTSFDSAGALMDACLDAMESMTEWERATLRTEILKAFGLRAMMAIGTVHLIERQHAQRLREVFGEDSARRVLGQLRSEALRALVDERVLADPSPAECDDDTPHAVASGLMTAAQYEAFTTPGCHTCGTPFELDGPKAQAPGTVHCRECAGAEAVARG